MATGLFADDEEFLRIPLPDADVRMLRSLDLGAPPEQVFSRLIEETPWRAETVVMWGKEYAQPRLIAWYGDPGATYTYSNTRHDPLAWTPLLADVRERVERATGERFDAVLLNYYRDHRDSVALHSDDERELGPEPVIASLSLGETRTFVMKHKTRRELKPRRLELCSGSLLVMRGATQRCWQHGVPKVSRPCGPRVNLTFRRLLTALP